MMDSVDDFRWDASWEAYGALDSAPGLRKRIYETHETHKTMG